MKWGIRPRNIDGIEQLPSPNTGLMSVREQDVRDRASLVLRCAIYKARKVAPFVAQVYLQHMEVLHKSAGFCAGVWLNPRVWACT